MFADFPLPLLAFPFTKEGAGKDHGIPPRFCLKVVKVREATGLLGRCRALVLSKSGGGGSNGSVLSGRCRSSRNGSRDSSHRNSRGGRGGSVLINWRGIGRSRVGLRGEEGVLGLRRGQFPTIVTGRPAYNLHAPVVNLIAEGLHGKDREGLFQLSTNFLNTEKHGGDDDRRGNETNVIPSVLEGIVHTKGKKKEPDGEETGQVTGVEQRDGTGQDTLRTSQIILKDGNGLVNFVLSHKVHGKVVNGKAQILQGTVGAVGSGNDHLGLLGGELLVQLLTEGGLVLLLGDEMTLHGTDEGPGAQGDVVKVVGALLGGNTAVVIVGVGHSGKITGE